MILYYIIMKHGSIILGDAIILWYNRADLMMGQEQWNKDPSVWAHITFLKSKNTLFIKNSFNLIN